MPDLKKYIIWRLDGDKFFMKMRVCRQTISICLLVIIFMPPGFMTYMPQLKALNYMLAIGRYLVTTMVLLSTLINKSKRKYYKNMFLIVLTIICSIMMLSMWLNGTFYITGAISHITIVGWVLANYHLFNADYRRTVVTYKKILFLYLLLHFVTELFFSQGLVGGYIGNSRVYFAGVKNAVSTYYLLYLIFALFIWMDKKKKNLLQLLMLFLPIDIFAIINNSTTSIMVVAVIQFFVFAAYVGKMINRKMTNCFSRWGSIICFSILVIFFFAEVYQNNRIPLLGNLSVWIGKEASFSGRREIWDVAMMYISDKPIWGMGLDVIYDAWGNNVLVHSAHNAFLDLGVKYGLITLSIYCGILTIVMGQIYKFRKITKHIIPELIYIVALFIVFMFEAAAGLYSTWLILTFITYLAVCKYNSINKTIKNEGSA